MKDKKIKIKDKEFNLIFPIGLEETEIAKSKCLTEWAELIKKQKTSTDDEWVELPAVPGYKFKGLKLTSAPFEVEDEDENPGEINLTISYDVVKTLNPKPSKNAKKK